MYKEEIRDFIEKLSNDIVNVNNFEEKMNSCKSWKTFFLYSGYPEIILYLTQARDIMLDKELDFALKHYIKQFKSNMQISQGYLNNKAGIIYGYCGIGYMLLELGKSGVNVDKLLTSINEIIYKILVRKLERVEKHLENYEVWYQDYDVLEGVSSSLRYIVEFRENDKFKYLINRIVQYLMTLTKFNKYNYPNYYLKPDKLDELRTRKNPNGIIDYGVAHGLAGILSSLSIAKIHGVEVDGIEDCIMMLLQELKRSMKNIDGINYWPGIISIDNYLINNFDQYNLNDYGWCYGVAGTARAVYLGGQACNKPEYMDIAIETFEQINLNIEQININTYILCHGYSGLLIILNEMYLDTRIESIKKAADIIASKILEWLQSTRLLEDLDKVESRGESNIDLWEGIIGIALAMINYADNSKELISKLMLVK
jgi:Lanthionine synthetase C-like protein.